MHPTAGAATATRRRILFVSAKRYGLEIARLVVRLEEAGGRIGLLQRAVGYIRCVCSVGKPDFSHVEKLFLFGATLDSLLVGLVEKVDLFGV